MLKVLLSAKLPSVTTLDLSGSWPESWPLHHLSQGTWSQLQQLDMHNSNLDAAAIEALISGSLPNLASLNISDNLDTMCAEAMRPLAQGQWPNLTSLILSDCNLHYINIASDATDEAATAMSELIKGAWPSLRSLDLHGNHISSDSIKLLLMGAWPNLTDLNLGESYFDAKTFACCAWQLGQLYLDSIGADEPAFTALSCLSGLKMLTLSYMQGLLCPSEPSMSCIQHKGISIWPDLQHLDLGQVPVSVRAAEPMMQADWPFCTH